MSSTRKKVVVLWSGDPDYTDAGGPGCRLVECAEWFAKQLAKVPLDCRESARVDFDPLDEYDGSRANLRVSYTRHQTPEEIAEEGAQVRELRKQREEREIQRMKELMEKYPDLVEKSDD